MSDYIKYIRNFVGHNTVLQCGASVIIENDKEEILLQLRTDNNCWGYVGGSVELDEIVEDAAKREMYEETSLIAEELNLFGVFSGPQLHYVYPNGDEVSNIDIVFICRKYSGKYIADGVESKELRFFDINELPENISPPIKPVLEKYVDFRKMDIKNNY